MRIPSDKLGAKERILTAITVFVMLAIIITLVSYHKDIIAVVSKKQLTSWQRKKVENNLALVLKPTDIKILASSNPYDYISEHQKEYDEIVAMGEPVANYFLDVFGKDEDNGLKQWIMARICNDILGDLNPIKTWSSGREWYEQYIKRIELMKKYGSYDNKINLVS